MAANVAIFVPHQGCPHQCAFCDQKRISGSGASIPDSDTVVRTLDRARETLGQLAHEAEIAFFGGSFTAIPREEMCRLLQVAQPYLGGDGFGGIRVSTRPDAIDDEILDLLKESGVTAIELGAQSMDDSVLAACGRGHTAADVEAAVNGILKRGFSLGLQMMTGLPGQTADSAFATMERLAALGPDTVRIYPTLVLEGTPLARWWRAGTYLPQTLEEAVDLCGHLLEGFVGRGIRVIRLGLHDSPTLKESLLAGPYHPAFRELLEGGILLRSALDQLKGAKPGEITLAVAPGATSKMVGQKRINLLSLEARGFRARVTEDPAMGYLAVRVKKDDGRKQI